VDYVGREIGDEFIVGYGLDYDEEGRELKDVWVVE
jgi:hypoxanthine phosphoribosyltransferase